MKAFLKNYRQSPRKVRLVTDLIKSKRVAEGILILDNLPKRAAGPIQTLLASAIANAKVAGINLDNLFIENVTVNEGIVMKRSMPRARGSASRINKRTSHIMLSLIEKGAEKAKEIKKVEKVAEVKKVEKKSKTTKKVAVKA